MQRPPITQTAAHADHLEVGYSTELPFQTVQTSREQATKPSDAEEPARDGSLLGQSPKMSHQPRNQEVVMMKKHTNPELPDTHLTGDITVTLCSKKESEKAEISQATATNRADIKSETKYTYAAEVQL